ncbi:MAG: hypothetical protein K1X42_17965 [Opitutaceae bacterium]|nr:hypothetical protein [Opitutaceae bacterium]
MNHTAIEPPSKLIEAFWIEKYLTFAQGHDGALRPTDHLFLAEYALKNDLKDALKFEAALYRQRESEPIQRYSGRDRLWCNRLWVNRKARSFDSLADLDRAHPPTDTYHWVITGPEIGGTSRSIRIGGEAGRTQIPRPHPMRLSQERRCVSNFNAIDPAVPLLIEWERFEGAAAGLGFDDTIFVFIDDCRGEVVFFGGLPTEADRISFESTSVVVPAGLLRAGEPYTIFYSQCKMVDQDIRDGLVNVAVNSFGVELDIHTTGAQRGDPCPMRRRMAPFRWKRKTKVARGLETWPTVADEACPNSGYAT